MQERAVKKVHLRWEDAGLAFRGGGDGTPEMVIDGDSVKGPSPMDALLLSLAGCMAADVIHILQKSRVPLEMMEVSVEGIRAATHPRRFEEITLVYQLEGPDAEDRGKVERAVELSRNTYCSVLNSLRPDIDVAIEIRGL